MAVHVKGGTPVFGPSLCETCSNAHVEKGYRESEQVVFCMVTYLEHRVQFPVRQCSGYREVKRQTLKQMEDIAWILPSSGNKRMAGFAPLRKQSGDDEEEITMILQHKPVKASPLATAPQIIARIAVRFSNGWAGFPYGIRGRRRRNAS